MEEREVGLELNTKKFKVGDGTSTWTQLDYWVHDVTGNYALLDLSNIDTKTLLAKGVQSGLLQQDLADIDLAKLYDKGIDAKLASKSDIDKKADIDLQNVNFTHAVRFNNAVNAIAAKHDIPPADFKLQLKFYEETSNVDFNIITDQFLHLKYQMTSDGQSLTQMLPPLSDIRTIIIDKVDSTGVSNTTLTLQPDGTDFINGSSTPITITENGIAGILFNSMTTWEWIPYSITHENGIVLSDDKNNIFLGEKNIKFAKSTLTKNGEEVTVTPDAYPGSSDPLIEWDNLGNSSSNHKSTGVTVEMPLKVWLDPNSAPNKPMSKLAIDHGYYEKKHSEGIFAKLSQDVEANVSNDKSEKFWFDEVRVGRNNSFVYPDMAKKSFVVQDVDPNDDPNISGGTLFLLAFDFQPIKEQYALGDGYLEIKAIDVATNTYIVDTDGNPIQARISYKTNEELRPEFIYGTYRATGAIDCAFEISGNIQDIIRVSANTCVLLQSILSNEIDGLAYLGFCNYTGYRFQNSNKYYGNGIMQFGSTLQQDEPFTIAEPNQGELDGNGIFIHNASRLQVQITNHVFIIKDNGGTDLPVFCMGKLFDSTDTKYLKGKTIKVKTTLKNKTNAVIVGIMSWTGEADKANYKMLTGYTNDQPQFITNWSESLKETLVSEPTLDIHQEVLTFTLPSNDNITQFAFILRPFKSEQPMDLEITDFDADVTPSFNELVFSKNIHISEEHLKYASTNYRFASNRPSWASAFRYTINSGHTPLPWGIVDDNINGLGEKLITNDGSWHTSSANYPNEGDGVFNADGHVTMYYRLTAFCGESAPADTDVGNQVWLSKVNDDGTFTKLLNSETIFIQHKDITTPTKVQSNVFEFDVKKGDKYRIFAQSDYNDGCYLQTSSTTQALLEVDIKFNSLTIEQEMADTIVDLREEKFIDYRYKISSTPLQITQTPALMPLGVRYAGNADIVVGEKDITALTDCIVNGSFTVTINGRSGNSGQTTLTLQIVTI
ncbi:MAG: hypothetical protein ACRCXT_18980, partial [Paraclostridium sp.]